MDAPVGTIAATTDQQNARTGRELAKSLAGAGRSLVLE
jgi:hypothetical protein